MIYYNSWLNNDAHSKALQAQRNEAQAGRYFEALKPLRSALDVALASFRRATELWRYRQQQKIAIRELSALDDRMLKDIDLPRSQIPNAVLNGRLDPQSARIPPASSRPPASKPAADATATTECQIIPLVQPDRTREMQHHPRGRRHRYPLPVNAA